MGTKNEALSDQEHLKVLGYEGAFTRSMSLWANFALGFTYLSPLVGVYSLFAIALQVGGPPSIFWIVIVGLGQLLVSFVFVEVVSQYPIAARSVSPPNWLESSVSAFICSSSSAKKSSVSSSTRWE